MHLTSTLKLNPSTEDLAQYHLAKTIPHALAISVVSIGGDMLVLLPDFPLPFSDQLYDK